MGKRVNCSFGRLTIAEISGSLGDLGILIPLLVGMAHQGSVHFVPALFFAGLWNFLSGLTWDVPMCVQPMKTIAAKSGYQSVATFRARFMQRYQVDPNVLAL